MTDGKTGTSAIVKAAESAAIALTHDTVKRYINAVATEQEVALFLNQCVMFALNPFKREIYLIKYKQGEPATFVVGYEVYLKRAERTKNWAGMESGTVDGPDGKPISAWVKVYRKDWERPLIHEVYYEEYVQTKAEWVNGAATGKKIPTRFWAEKPRTMLKKVAIAQAFRMAFPDEMAGMPYIAEERISEPDKLPTAEIITEASGPAVHAPDLTDPKVDPFSKAGYEAMKKTPLKDIKDEFTDPPPPDDDDPLGVGPEPKKEEEAPIPPPRKDGPTMAQMEKFAKVKAVLMNYGVDEQKMWAGIHRFCEKSLGRLVTELGDFTQPEIEMVIGYLYRWEKALTTEKEAKKGAKR